VSLIRIIKSPEPPAVLLERGVPATARLCEEYDRAPADYQSGTKRLVISDAIYAHRSVVDALISVQHRKCCFCDRKTLGDVEHFRPKQGFRQRLSDPLTRPGYYWLAYEWNNLFMACGPCNQRLKGNLFPLLQPERRARSHRDDIGHEEPLLLHPRDDEPSHHIGFRQEVAFAVDGSVRGQATRRCGTPWRMLRNSRACPGQRWDEWRALSSSLGATLKRGTPLRR
jgi:hypothetical protein